MHILKLTIAWLGILTGQFASAASDWPSPTAGRQLISLPPLRHRPRPVVPRASLALTLDNFVYFVRIQVRETSESRIKMVKSTLEKNIIHSLTENPDLFLRHLTEPAVEYLLTQTDGISILQRIDSLMTNAVQELGERANFELHMKHSKGHGIALERISRIRLIEKKRDELAARVAAQRTEMNFNSVFDYMVQAHFRRTDGLNQGPALPKTVRLHLYGHNNPYLTAFQTLKQMTFSVLTGDKAGPLQTLRQLKIVSTAELTPPFKPTLQAWTVEANFLRRYNNRLPSSTSNSLQPDQQAFSD